MKTKSRATLIWSCAVSVLLTAIVAWSAARYLGVEAAAEQAQVDALAAQLGMVSAHNFKDRAEVVHERNLVVPAAIANCEHISALLPERKLPAGYRIQSQPIPVNGSIECTLTYKSLSANFTGHGI